MQMGCALSTCTLSLRHVMLAYKRLRCRTAGSVLFERSFTLAMLDLATLADIATGNRRGLLHNQWPVALRARDDLGRVVH